MPRRYNDAIYKDSVGALLQQSSSGVSGNGRRCVGEAAGSRQRARDLWVVVHKISTGNNLSAARAVRWPKQWP